MEWTESEADLNVPESIVALLLARSGGGAQVEEAVDGVGDGAARRSQLVHHVGGVGVSREGLGRQQELRGGHGDGAEVAQHSVTALAVLLSGETYMYIGAMYNTHTLTFEAPARVSPAASISLKVLENFAEASAWCSGVLLAAVMTSLPAMFRAAAQELRLLCNVW